MVQVLGDFDRHPAVPQPEEGVTYAAKIDKAETRLNFDQPADAVERQIRAFNPPGAWFEHGGERIRVLAGELFPGEGRGPAATGPILDPGLRRGTVMDERLTIACASGAIRPTLVQRAGRGVVTTRELLNGFPIPPGTRL
jgi:methionyl-tRNA formyltransferase